MSFQAPLFLLGLAVVPLALAALWLARRRAGALRRPLPGAADARGACCRGAPPWRRIVPPALLCLALAGLALALARPEATVAVPVERASVVLVTDTSGIDERHRRRAVAARRRRRPPPSGSSTTCPTSCGSGSSAYADAPGTVVRPTDGPRRRPRRARRA